MKIASSSDWRDAVPFETPVRVADLLPGDPTRCSVCGTGSPLRDRTDLWALKHRHPNDHGGYVRFYCSEHLPVIEKPRPAVVPARAARRAAPRTSTPRRTPAPERERAMCPDCFIEVSATGECGMCGRTA